MDIAFYGQIRFSGRENCLKLYHCVTPSDNVILIKSGAIDQ